MDPVQQKRMAWSGQDDDEEENFSSPLPATTTAAVSIRPITAERSLQMSTTDLTTSKTMEGANHPTEEPKRTIGPLLHRKKTSAGTPTSFTSKAAGLISTWSYLCLLSFITFLIDNHSAAWWWAARSKNDMGLFLSTTVNRRWRLINDPGAILPSFFFVLLSSVIVCV